MEFSIETEIETEDSLFFNSGQQPEITDKMLLLFKGIVSKATGCGSGICTGWAVDQFPDFLFAAEFKNKII